MWKAPLLQKPAKVVFRMIAQSLDAFSVILKPDMEMFCKSLSAEVENDWSGIAFENTIVAIIVLLKYFG